MQKKLASSFILAAALVGTIVAPSYADDDTFKNICQFPVKMLGSSVSTVIGVPLGAVKDGTKGARMSTKWVAGKLGNEDGQYQQWFGAVLGGPFGVAGGAAYGCFDGGWHGMKTGYEKPFTKDSFTFKED